MEMESTCKGKDCWFYILMKDLISDSSKLKIEDCPFYQEMVWTPLNLDGKNGTAKIIKDCANKRSLLVLLEDVLPRLYGVQQSNEDMRNKTHEASEIITQTLQSVVAKQIYNNSLKEGEENGNNPYYRKGSLLEG